MNKLELHKYKAGQLPKRAVGNVDMTNSWIIIFSKEYSY